MHVGECGAPAAQDVLEAGEPGPLAGQGNLFHHILVEIFAGGFDVAPVQDFFDELADDGGVLHKDIRNINREPREIHEQKEAAVMEQRDGTMLDVSLILVILGL